VRSLEQDLAGAQGDGGLAAADAIPPSYQHPRKNWRLKRGAVPQWYKARNGVRTKALSGAARVARYRPKKFH
jgi:sec-independent protein translocase protein TatB